MKRILLLLPLAVLVACSGNLSESDCLALEDTQIRLLARSKAAARHAAEIQGSVRRVRNDKLCILVDVAGRTTESGELWKDCSLRVAQEAGVLTSNREIKELAGMDYVSDFVITDDIAQSQVNESREWLAKAQSTAKKMNSGNCALSN